MTYVLLCHLLILFQVAQIMYHYGNSVTDIREQREALQLACNALLSIPSGHDSTDRLFIYPIQNEYHVRMFDFVVEF